MENQERCYLAADKKFRYVVGQIGSEGMPEALGRYIDNASLIIENARRLGMKRPEKGAGVIKKMDCVDLPDDMFEEISRGLR
jgi:hypothetical protein